MPSVSVTIMAFNEQATIRAQVLETIRFFEAKGMDFEVVVVDDGSTDNTSSQIQGIGDPRVRLIRHPTNMGMGAAIRHGYEASTKDFVTQLPGDMQVTANAFEPFLPLLDRYDLVLSRYKKRDDGLLRRVVSLGFQALSQVLLGYWCSITGTMFIRRELLKGLPIRSNTFMVNCEIPLRLMKRGVEPAFVAIEARPRSQGRSKVLNFKKIWNVTKEMYLLGREL